MEQDEINQKWESFLRTEKALDDEYTEHLRKLRTFYNECKDFIKFAKAAGYVWGQNGWEKK
jgi:hypothetical protein